MPLLKLVVSDEHILMEELVRVIFDYGSGNAFFLSQNRSEYYHFEEKQALTDIAYGYCDTTEVLIKVNVHVMTV